ncbi:hypothetical protein RMSM_05579 [Rhodopirellula maiorica SM1]|uniref:Uncharacterized protein n=1 Tax=Rhodopirellula maiorica SM1 TaxID=1265738 RepID=M5REG9_9BACT|nr:hypothetical protein RMSM_05579 [Rhodopirellula maiorica SM1]
MSLDRQVSLPLITNEWCELKDQPTVRFIFGERDALWLLRDSNSPPPSENVSNNLNTKRGFANVAGCRKLVQIRFEAGISAKN